jgi:hypothetical protein
LFNHNIKLQINKRLKTEKDKNIMKNLQYDIFNNKLKLLHIINKYKLKVIFNIKDLKITNNIAYFNKKCDRVNVYVHNNLIKIPSDYVEINNIKYYKGLKLVCKKHLSLKQNNNFETPKDYEI